MKSLLLAFALSFASAVGAQPVPATDRPAPLPTTIIVPASDFLHELPKGDVIADAGTLKAPWLFNNTSVVLKSKTNLMTSVQVPEAGAYHLYVRSQGEAATSFAVAVNDKVTAPAFGRGALAWQDGGVFNLPAGRADIKITRIDEAPAFDVIVLSKRADLTAEHVRPYQLHDDVRLLAEYKILSANAVKFGDATGDGRTDLLVLEPDFSAHMIDHSGRTLWSYQAPGEYRRERSEFEAPGVLWDFDRDGRAEAVHWRFIDGREWLVVADGRSGAILRKVAWPTKPLPHVYNNFRMAIAKLRPGAGPNEIVVFTDFGGGMDVHAFDAQLKSLWSHAETRQKDNLGHYIYPIDLDGDGLDEVLVGSLLLDRNGKKIWDRFDLLPDNRDHADSYKFADMDGDGKLDILSANSETGVFVYQGMTGRILWQNTAEHSQQLAVGDFLTGTPAPQVVIGGRTYGNRAAGEPYLSSQLYWFDRAGALIRKWPGTPLNSNPDFVRGNWRGDGSVDLFWFKFRLNDRGAGQLYFPDPVFHMFDFTGRGADEVVTLTRGTLRVYGYANARHSGRDAKADIDYAKSVVANHTHY